MNYRSALTPADVNRVEVVTRATGFFSEEEIGIARELVEENLSKGEAASEYYFLVLDAANAEAQPHGGIDAYACFGPIPGTKASFDLYWIVVAPNAQGRGLGRQLVSAVELRVRAVGGRRLYADTSSRAQYAPTRAFYERSGFVQVALLEDYYDDGDGKVMYLKTPDASRAQAPW
jgi:ribosomal protein S18 acetylase RimI-like enzyme